MELVALHSLFLLLRAFTATRKSPTAEAISIWPIVVWCMVTEYAFLQLPTRWRYGVYLFPRSCRKQTAFTTVIPATLAYISLSAAARASHYSNMRRATVTVRKSVRQRIQTVQWRGCAGRVRVLLSVIRMLVKRWPTEKDGHHRPDPKAGKQICLHLLAECEAMTNMLAKNNTISASFVRTAGRGRLLSRCIFSGPLRHSCLRANQVTRPAAPSCRGSRPLSNSLITDVQYDVLLSW